ncbi:GNAT family N-acetyltransferase [Natrinema longum]|uniref:GNAT family N-acetyltransferase n=1 Tax=Natrinema longum TaxID=370324 RepID=UPI001CC9B51F|nr:GNAT family N-acetyltransferase [Natrinema longum]MBZ6497046.1 GNAT family N-acetyltransferase [Natrinema longum]
MGTRHRFTHNRRRRIYEYVERNGAVEPESVRRNVLIRPETESKPARSGSDLEPSVTMSTEEFTHHVSVLERDGYLDERNGKLRIALPMNADETTIEFDDLEAIVRPAQQEDITGIVGVIETIATGETHVVAAKLADEISRNDVLLRHNESEDRVFFVATVDDDTVGWLHVEGMRFPNLAHTAELTVGVLERYRGNGLGSTLMDRGLEWARSQDYRKIHQRLPATNERAISFLEDQGWTVESTRDGHYHIDGDLVDEVQLAVWPND